ncbi:MAG: ATP-binding cassette domain-containing protein [Mollicutes bacterium PWAP]|nr:ATP-binding cassette domain-containing protein [Mollicutes bacterium PWAP]
MIEIQNLDKKFEDKTHALKNISIKFPDNQITGLIGFNGSGKSTTFNIVSDFIEKYKGNVLFDGHPITMEDKRTISYLAAGAEPKNKTKSINQLIEAATLQGMNKKEAKILIENIAKKLEFTEYLKKPIGKLSKGNQQKVKIISTFLNPSVKYIFLDEPFDGLDPVMVEKVKAMYMDLHKNKKISIIITSHRMDVVQSMVKEFFVLKKGILVDSKTNIEKNIFVKVNEKVKITPIKKLNFVKSAIKKENKILITIDKIENFKKLNKLLISDKEYIYSTIKEKNIAASVFKGENISLGDSNE